MRIGIDLRACQGSVSGGVPIYTENLVKHLLRIDHENHYVLFLNSFRSLPWDSTLETWGGPNVEIRRFNFPNRFLNTSLFLWRYPYLDRLIGGVDLFVAPNLNFFSFSPRCRTILTVHDLSFVFYPSFYSFKGRWWHRFLRPRFLFRSFDHLIAVSEHTRRDLIRFFEVSKDKVTVISPGVDLESFSETSVGIERRILEKYRLPEVFFLTLSASDPRKNLLGTLRAFEAWKEKSANNIHLVIAGSPGSQKKELLKRWKKSSWRDMIHPIGMILPEEKPSLLRLARLFIYPSFYEGFGFPPLEAMAAGVPVIVSHASSLPEILGDAALLTNPYHIEEIAAAFDAVHSDEALRNTLIERGKKRIEHFSWEKTAKETLELFKHLTIFDEHADWH